MLSREVFQERAGLAVQGLQHRCWEATLPHAVSGNPGWQTCSNRLSSLRFSFCVCISRDHPGCCHFAASGRGKWTEGKTQSFPLKRLPGCTHHFYLQGFSKSCYRDTRTCTSSWEVRPLACETCVQLKHKISCYRKERERRLRR